MIRVAYDFDGVLNNLPEAWTNYLKGVFYDNNDEGKTVELKYYDMCRNFPNISYSSIMWPLCSSEFWKTVELEPGAKEALDILQARQDVEVFIVTSTSPESWTTKYEYCFKRLFPDFPVDNIILTSRKELINCNILIEDNPEFLKDFKGTKILLDKSYNKSVKNDSFKHFNNHDDIVEFVKSFVNTYNNMGGGGKYDIQSVKVRLDTQKDVAEFVNIADTIEEDVYLVDNTYNRVSGRSLMRCLYSLEFSESYVESNYEGLSNKFENFLL